jgi:hypothetical protein
MKAAATRTSATCRQICRVALTIALDALIGGLSSLPARADDDGRGRQGRERGHDDRGRGSGDQHKHKRYENYRYDEGPRYVYPPPAIYYAPPPRQPVIDLFPIIIR